MRRISRSGALVPILIVVVLAFFAQKIISPTTEEEPPTYNEFLAMIQNDEEAAGIEGVEIKVENNEIEVVEKDGTEYTTGYLQNSEQSLQNDLLQADIPTTVKGASGGGILSFLTYLLPFVLILAFWIFLMNQMQGGGSRVMNFGKSKAKRMSVDAPKITFRDVAGTDEAVQELHEIKEFLENPKKFQALGARIPKGVLL
ncbi:MAG: ATP-dependent zinc metalloprotease FtsH, partial [Solirubrobacterales bacterium]